MELLLRLNWSYSFLDLLITITTLILPKFSSLFLSSINISTVPHLFYPNCLPPPTTLSTSSMVFFTKHKNTKTTPTLSLFCHLQLENLCHKPHPLILSLLLRWRERKHKIKSLSRYNNVVSTFFNFYNCFHGCASIVTFNLKYIILSVVFFSSFKQIQLRVRLFVENMRLNTSIASLNLLNFLSYSNLTLTWWARLEHAGLDRNAYMDQPHDVVDRIWKFAHFLIYASLTLLIFLRNLNPQKPPSFSSNLLHH